MIQDKCYMIRNVETGIYEFFGSWTEIAKMLGVTRQYVCRCRDQGAECKGYEINKKAVRRVYFVKSKDGNRGLCVVKVKDRVFVNVGTGERIAFRAVEEVKDLTYQCKNGKDLSKELLWI